MAREARPPEGEARDEAFDLQAIAWPSRNWAPANGWWFAHLARLPQPYRRGLHRVSLTLIRPG
jgi:hypothetical protein